MFSAYVLMRKLQSYQFAHFCKQNAFLSLFLIAFKKIHRSSRHSAFSVATAVIVVFLRKRCLTSIRRRSMSHTLSSSATFAQSTIFFFFFFFAQIRVEFLVKCLCYSNSFPVFPHLPLNCLEVFLVQYRLGQDFLQFTDSNELGIVWHRCLIYICCGSV
jgi:hypothetical protein